MLSNKRLVSACVFALCVHIAVIAVFVTYNIGEKCFVTIGSHQVVTSVIPDDFLSFGVDTSQLEEAGGAGAEAAWANTRLRAMTAELAPARMRLGGTMSERLIFSEDENIDGVSCEACHHNHFDLCSSVRKLCKHKFLPFFIMTGSQWTDINNFCNATNIKLLFSFNALLRTENGWSELNARDILGYSQSKNFNVDWQLGNEPNSYQHVFNVTIHPEQLGRDFRKLRHLLNEFGYNNSLLVGPDTTRPEHVHPGNLKYMLEFLGNASHYINVRSWHQYYLNSRTAKLDDFWDPSTFDLLKQQIKIMKNHTEKYKDIPMWLSETSSSYGGGAPGLSDTYAGTPLWVDKLGLSAKYNITTVIRQTLFGGNYSLIDKNNWQPHPDWWVSVLYKRLVGNKVLHVKCNCSRYQRMYAHCASRRYTNDTSAVSLYAINLEFKKVTFLLNGTALHGGNLEIDEYIFSAPSNNRQTKTILLNGRPLSYESSMPELIPRHLKYGNHISMRPYSIGFWVIRNTSIKICN